MANRIEDELVKLLDAHDVVFKSKCKSRICNYPHIDQPTLKHTVDALLNIITAEVKEARIEELELMHEKSFGWKRNKQLISGFVEDYYDRLKELSK